MAHVLILEPDRRLAQIYAAALHYRQYSAIVTATAQDAIIEADKTRPDAVLLELQLTGHSGIEFLYEFRSYTDWTAVPVVVNSIVPPDEFDDSRQLLRDRLGVVAYSYKPHTDLKAIISSIEKALARPAAAI